MIKKSHFILFSQSQCHKNFFHYNSLYAGWLCCFFLFIIACKHKDLPNQSMIDLLAISARYDHNPENVFSPEAMIESCDSILNTSPAEEIKIKTLVKKANALLQTGQEQKAIDIDQELLNKISLGNIEQRLPIMKDMANAYFRMGERLNCIHNHMAE